MEFGSTVDGRFFIQSLAGSGGMGHVYRARDERTGDTVALKVLREGVDGAAERFGREVRSLAALSHANVVGHVAHGQTRAGPYLAMEWLDGHDLSTELKLRRALTIEQTLTVARQIAAGLGHAHTHGLVHRDVKPSNIFFVNGDLERVKVIDFGLARGGDARSEATLTGVIVGTPGYMAPEQIRAADNLTAAADVFALACVIFKCLTGKGPFQADNVVGTLARVLFEPPPRLSEVFHSSSLVLDLLLEEMLSKDASQRPRDGATVEARLQALTATVPPPPRSASSLGRGERRIISLVLAGAQGQIPTVDPEETLLRAPHDALDASAARAALAPYGGELAPLPDGSFVVAFGGEGAATDHAARAAHCALLLQSLLPNARVALATGRAEVGQRLVGEAIDRAADLLREAQSGAYVSIDDVTAGLLDARFEVMRSDTGFSLRRPLGAPLAARTLLGKVSPCVGRERDIGGVLGALDACIEEASPRAVVITAPAGTGKSRLRYEVLRGIETSERDVQVWIARGDPIGAGSAFGFIGPALRRAAGISEGESLPLRRQRLRSRVAESARNKGLNDAEVARITEFIGELTGVPFDDTGRVQLRTARRDPAVMGDQTRRAFVDFLRAECATRPLVLVLEDAHWSDPPSIAYVDYALRALRGSPLFVLALARPEIDETFPNLFGERGATSIRLAGLSRRASEQLVRSALGSEVSSLVVARVVERAAGNAFYLEELVRAVAYGKGDEFPDTVLAMAQGRLDSLPGDLRRVLRAGSVFGVVFWRDAAAALLGEERESLDDWLSTLADKELIEPRHETRFPGSREYVFRHALVREAAYATLTEDDRAVGHGLAADWLERTGDRDPVVLAEHFERGGLRSRAAPYYASAAQAALLAKDFRGALARVASAAACGVEGAELGKLEIICSESYRWLADSSRAIDAATAAMALLPPGSEDYFRASAEVAFGVARRGDLGDAIQIGEMLLPYMRTKLTPALAIASARAAAALVRSGKLVLADELLNLLSPAETPNNDPVVRAEISRVRAQRALPAGDIVAHLRYSEATLAIYDEVGDVRSSCVARANLGYAKIELGLIHEAAALMHTALDDALRLELPYAVAAIRHNYGYALVLIGRVDEGIPYLQQAMAFGRTQVDHQILGASQMYLALAHLQRGDAAESERIALLAMESLATMPPLLPQVSAVLARALLAQGRTGEARTIAARGLEQLRQLGSVEEGETRVYVAAAVCMRATRDVEGARAVITEGVQKLQIRAARIFDEAVREKFRAYPDNAEALQLARELAW